MAGWLSNIAQKVQDNLEHLVENTSQEQPVAGKPVSVESLKALLTEKDKELEDSQQKLKVALKTIEENEQRRRNIAERYDILNEEFRKMQEDYSTSDARWKEEKRAILEQQTLSTAESAEENRDALREALNDRNKKVSELEKELADVKERSLKVKATALTKVKKLQAELDELKAAQTPENNAEALTSLRNQIAELEEEKGNLQLQLVDAEEVKVNLDSLLSEAARSKVERERLSAENHALQETLEAMTLHIREMQDKHAGEMADAHGRVFEANVEMAEKLHQEMLQRAQLEKELESLETSRHSLVKENEGLRERVGHIEAREKELLTDALQSDQQQTLVEDLRAKLVSYEESQSLLKEQLRVLLDERHQIKSQHEETIIRLLQEKELAVSEIAMLQSQQKSGESLKSMQIEESSRSQQVLDEQHKKELDSARIELHDLLNSERQTWEREREQLCEELRVLRERDESDDNTRLEEQRSLMESTLQLKAQILALNEQLMQKEADFAAVTSSYNDLKAQYGDVLGKMHFQADTEQHYCSRITELEQQLSAISNVNTESQETASSLNSTILALHSSIELLHRQLNEQIANAHQQELLTSDLQQQLKLKNEELSQTEHRLQTLAEDESVKMASLIDNLREMEGQLLEKETLLEGSLSEANRLRQEVSHLENTVQEKETSQKKYLTLIKKLKSDLKLATDSSHDATGFESRIQSLQDNNAELTSRLHSREQESESLRVEISNLSAKCHQLEAESTALGSANYEMTQLLGKQQAELENYSSQKGATDDLQLQVLNLRKELEASSHSAAELTRQVQTLTAENFKFGQHLADVEALYKQSLDKVGLLSTEIASLKLQEKESDLILLQWKEQVSTIENLREFEKNIRGELEDILAKYEASKAECLILEDKLMRSEQRYEASRAECMILEGKLIESQLHTSSIQERQNLETGLRDQLEVLRMQCDSSQAECLTLKDQLRRLQQQHQVKQDEYLDLDDRFMRTEQLYEAAKADCQHMRAEIGSQAVRFQELLQTSSFNEQKLQEETEIKRRIAGELDRVKEEMQELSNLLEDRCRLLDSTEKRLGEANFKLDQLTLHCTQLEQQLATKASESDLLKVQLENAISDNAKAQNDSSELLHLKQVMVKVEHDLKDRTHSLDVKTKHLHEMDARLGQMTSHSLELEQRLAAKASEIDRLMVQLENAVREKDEAHTHRLMLEQQALVEVEALKQSTALETNSKLSEVRSKLNQLEIANTDLLDRLAAAQGALANAEAETMSLRANLERNNSELAALVREKDAALAGLRHLLTQNETQASEKHAKIQFEKELVVKEKEALGRELQKLLVLQTEEKERLATELSTVSSGFELEINALQVKVEQLQGENSLAQEAKASADRRLAEARRQFDMLENSHNQTEQMVISLTQAKGQLELENRNLKKSLDSSRPASAASQASLGRLSQENTTLQQRVHQLEAQLETLAELEEELHVAKQTLLELQTERETLSARLDTAEMDHVRQMTSLRQQAEHQLLEANQALQQSLYEKDQLARLLTESQPVVPAVATEYSSIQGAPAEQSSGYGFQAMQRTLEEVSAARDSAQQLLDQTTLALQLKEQEATTLKHKLEEHSRRASGAPSLISRVEELENACRTLTRERDTLEAALEEAQARQSHSPSVDTSHSHEYSVFVGEDESLLAGTPSKPKTGSTIRPSAISAVSGIHDVLKLQWQRLIDKYEHVLRTQPRLRKALPVYMIFIHLFLLIVFFGWVMC